MRFFWAKGLGGSWRGGGGGGGVLGVLIGGSEPKWEMRRTRWGGSTGCIMHRVHTSLNNPSSSTMISFILCSLSSHVFFVDMH